MTEQEKAQEIFDFYDNYGIPLEQKRQCCIFVAEQMLLQFTWRPKTGQSYWEKVKEILIDYDPYE